MRAQLARKATAAFVIALFPLTACGSDLPSREALKNKLKTEAIYQGLSDKQADCLAGVLLKYAEASDLKDYVDGKRTSDALHVPVSKQAEAAQEATACVTDKR